jgi:hypothetical protein
MFVLLLILATGSLSTHVPGALLSTFTLTTWNEFEPTTHLERSGDVYRVYGGTGEVSEGWPAQSAWVADFEIM